MLNRRFLRIKVFQALYSYYQNDRENMKKHEDNMFESPEKAYLLYYFLLAFPSEFHFFLIKELDVQTSKHLPDKELIRQISTLAKNKIFVRFEQNESVREVIRNHKIKWTASDEVFKNIFTTIRKSVFWTDYYKNEFHTFVEDRKLVMDIYEMMFCDLELFDQYIEDRFINWEDDQLTSALTVMRGVKKMKELQLTDLVEKVNFHNREDRDFMKELFEMTVEKELEFLQLIKEKATNWETDRIALVDFILMKMALCELLYYPQIPVKVTINEYLELAKQYSTPASHGFINGVLDKIQLELRVENKIIKTGRGLME